MHRRRSWSLFYSNTSTPDTSFGKVTVSKSSNNPCAIYLALQTSRATRCNKGGGGGNSRDRNRSRKRKKENEGEEKEKCKAKRQDVEGGEGARGETKED